MYKNIINAIIAAYDKYINDGAEYIRTNDSTLQRNSTSKRWGQYQRGEISREKCAEYALIRQRRNYERSRDRAISRAERIADAPEVKELSISIMWTRSRTWAIIPAQQLPLIALTGHTLPQRDAPAAADMTRGQRRLLKR